ncbi:hypothetical protein MKX01_003741 [Papaver californicum]|nr:hypothetical protein MKX01_037908 [Papaver californicum]KAI3991584.1 hypothetical protein MKX01_003741 [Papaver californicum]
MEDKNLKDVKGNGVVVYNEDHQVNQESIEHPPQFQNKPFKIAIGFKFKPSDDELVSYYLKKKIENPDGFQPSCIPCRNIYDYLPEELLEGNKGMDAYFFTPRNKRYLNGTRAARSVKQGYGYWRMGSVPKDIRGVNGRKIGFMNSLTFHEGENKKTSKPTDWLMKEYVISSNNNMRLDDWVICRVHFNMNKKRTESTAEIGSTCNKKQRIEKEREGGKGEAGIKIEGRENVTTTPSNVPRPVYHYGDQFNYYNPQFGGNNLALSMMSSNSLPSIQHNHNNYQYQFGGYSGMIHQQHQQQPHQQFGQHQQQPHQQFEQHLQPQPQQFEQQQQQHYYMNNSINSIHTKHINKSETVSK